MRYRFEFQSSGTPELVFAADQALGFESRQRLVRDVRARTGLRLCGADVPCPGGDGS